MNSIRKISLFKFVCLALGCGLASSWAAEKTFSLGGASISLEDVSAEVEVRYQAMRLNRALNVWNVEAVLENKGTQVLQGPVVLLVDSFSGTTGPLQTDGADDGTPAKKFYELSASLKEAKLSPGEKATARTLTLGVSTGVPKLVTKVFAARAKPPLALALVRTLDAAGQPLTSVKIEEVGPNGIVSLVSDPIFGVATLGQGSGGHVWKFSKTGASGKGDYLPVWRKENLALGEVTVLPNPRLTQRSANVVNVTPIGGVSVASGDGSIQITIPPAAFTQNATVTLTALTSQTLPAFLPRGWSPMAAFWIESGSEPAGALNALLRPIGAINQTEPAALARLNPATLAWEVTALAPGNGINPLNVTISASGAYVLVVGDVAPQPAPAPVVGQPLGASGANLPAADSLTATGTVTPSQSSANRQLDLVTANAEVVISTSTGSLPSGMVLRGEVTEDYRLLDGTRRHPPEYEQFLSAYQRLGNSGGAVRSLFPMRPLLLFGSEELDEAKVRVGILTPTPFTGGVLDEKGGLVASEGIRILAGAGDLSGKQAAELRVLNPTNFADLAASASVSHAFQLSVAGVAANHHLRAEFPTLSPNGFFVLARVLYDSGLYGLQPVERLSSDADGKLHTGEVAEDFGLTGIIGAGQYVLLRVGAAQGMVAGIARNSAGQAVAGLPVSVEGQPWLTFSGADGSYVLIAPIGSVKVTARDLASGDVGSVVINLPRPDVAVGANPQVAPAGPTVLSMDPTNQAVRVSRMTAVTVTFSEAINPVTLPENGIQLIGADGQAVPATFTLNLKNSVVTLLPTEQLAANSAFTVKLSTNITDLTGLKLEGANMFTFTTESDLLNRPNTGLTIFEGGTAYEIIENLHFKNGRLESGSPQESGSGQTAPLKFFKPKGGLSIRSGSGGGGGQAPISSIPFNSIADAAAQDFVQGAKNNPMGAFGAALNPIGTILDVTVTILVLGVRPLTVTGRVGLCAANASGGCIDELLDPFLMGFDLLAPFPLSDVVTDLQAHTRKALPGAFISLSLPHQATALAGRLQPGIAYATSNRKGLYALVAPFANAGYVITATHLKRPI